VTHGKAKQSEINQRLVGIAEQRGSFSAGLQAERSLSASAVPGDGIGDRLSQVVDDRDIDNLWEGEICLGQ
jgi:hypothetical protein